MLSPARIAQIREKGRLRQDDLAFLLGVGNATVPRWERRNGTEPTGLARQLLEALDDLDTRGVDLSGLRTHLERRGNLSAILWILNQLHATEARADVVRPRSSTVTPSGA